MSDLVENTEDRFSCDMAQILLYKICSKNGNAGSEKKTCKTYNIKTIFFQENCCVVVNY